jgi:hypothetical protein
MHYKSTSSSGVFERVSNNSFESQYLARFFLVVLVWFSGLANGAQEKPITNPPPEGQFVTTTSTNRAVAELKLRQLRQALSKNSYHADHILDRIQILQKQLHGER